MSQRWRRSLGRGAGGGRGGIVAAACFSGARRRAPLPLTLPGVPVVTVVAGAGAGGAVVGGNTFTGVIICTHCRRRLSGERIRIATVGIVDEGVAIISVLFSVALPGVPVAAALAGGRG